MALVAADGSEFYEVIPLPENLDPWVVRNVIPILNKEPISFSLFQSKLEKFLMQFDAIHILADWPEDIKWFMDSLITGPGFRLNTPALTCEVRRDLSSSKSKIEHNALSDARAVLESYYNVSIK